MQKYCKRSKTGGAEGLGTRLYNAPSTVDYAMTYNNTGSGDPMASLDRILGACEHGVFVCIHSNIGMVSLVPRPRGRRKDGLVSTARASAAFPEKPGNSFSFVNGQ